MTQFVPGPVPVPALPAVTPPPPQIRLPTEGNSTVPRQASSHEKHLHKM
jgi:hypothetical protein